MSRQNSHLHIWHAMSHAQSLLFLCWTSSAHSTRISNPTSLLFPSHGDDHCDDPRHKATFGQLAESNAPAGYEPNDLTEMNNTEVTPMFFHRPSMTSTYDSAESIAYPPPESDVDDKHTRNTLASPLYLHEREARADRPRVYHSLRENSVSSSSHSRESAAKLAAVFSHKRKSSQESGVHSDRDCIHLAHRAVQGENGALTRLSESEKGHEIIS